jgi:exopolyphosphatase / guanosine-5'-triphosphate,3'-diphosphate pyrophosphatase
MELSDEKFRELVLELAFKYMHDHQHIIDVEGFALIIFDFLLVNKFHKFGASERVLLSHACILHDIGNFISGKKHNKHTKYIIENDESLENYPERERKLLSIITYNHRKKIHDSTIFLQKQDKDIVIKLSAILRVSDSLYFKDANVYIKEICVDNLGMIIKIGGILPEKLNKRVIRKSDVFKDVFNMDITLDV